MRKFLIFTFVVFAARLRKLLMKSDSAFKLLLTPRLQGFRTLVGEWKAWRVFEIARRDCPAYAAFLAEHPNSEVKLRGWRPDFSAIPETDKKNYVLKYGIEERCIGGELPTSGAQVDESSGSTGEPNNWVRGYAERECLARTMQLALHHSLGGGPLFFLNAFALGPWATGMTVSSGIIDICLLKSVGPDASKIVKTLKKFGPRYRYIIAGYPPFLKSLVDAAELDWSQYDIVAFYGGEGISESMRAYLCKAFKKVYGSYGASDLEINIGVENDWVINIRKLMVTNENLRRRFNGSLGDRLPMVFQYNPIDYLVESNEKRELVITLCRADNAAPKVRYNIHDTGHCMSFDEVAQILKEEGIDPESLAGDTPLTTLPVMFHYGRSDMAVGYFGCKITPGEVESIVYGLTDLATTISAFALVTSEDEKNNKRLTVALELRQGQSAPANIAAIRDAIFGRLEEVNQDFRESIKMVPADIRPEVKFYEQAEGPFKLNDIRVKLRYIQEQ
jgi:phenylacetate-CoA ligase